MLNFFSPSDESFFSYASAKSLSLYPFCYGRPYREGDPICDYYRIELFSNAAILCVADGCNWGDKPRRAAQVVTETAASFVKRYLPQMKTIADVIHMLTASLVDCHMAITDGPEEAYIGKNTTMNIGVSLEIDTNWVEKQSLLEINNVRSENFSSTIVPTNWVFACVNIGDCKVLHISHRTREVSDITVVSRFNLLDPTDPGGRLGPYNGKSQNIK